MLSINTNVTSLTAQNNLTSSQSALQTSLQRLSSGLRINSAKDDAAGLAISSRMSSQINGINQAARNANDGISLAQTAEGDLGNISNNLQRMRDLSVQSANGTNSASDRAALQTEVTALKSEIDRVSQQSSFNGISLLNGSFTGVNFQVGANAGQTVSVGSIANAQSTALGGYTVAAGAATGGLGLLAGGLTIAKGNGAAVSVGASTAGSGAGQSAGSAWAVAAAINSANAGVFASASTSVAGATGTAAGAPTTGTLTINGINTASITTVNTLATDKAAAFKAINDISNQTGVTAVMNAGNIDLKASDGRDIAVGVTGGTGAAEFGLTAATNHGTVSLVSDTQAITIGGTAAGATASGFTAGAAAGVLSSVSAIDISTATGAGSAVSVIDAALSTVNTARAGLGALQSRFSSVVSSLNTQSTNLSASRSRIEDTDFAAETANMTRNQILQQAGTAMLAQANALPNSVLSLLK